MTTEENLLQLREDSLVSKVVSYQRTNANANPAQTLWAVRLLDIQHETSLYNKDPYLHFILARSKFNMEIWKE